MNDAASRLRAVACFSIALAIAGYANDSLAQSGEEVAVSDVEVTADGLHRVDPALLRSTWLLPDADLSLYTHAFVMPTFTVFREIPQTSTNAWKDRSRSVFEVSENMQVRLRETFGEAFHEAMARQRDYEIADGLGRDVILVQAYMTDVTTGLPPEHAGNDVISIRWIWEANLTLELRDSMSNQILARIRARERVDGPVNADRLYSLAPQIMRRWSGRLLEQLDALSSFYPSRLYRMHERATQQSGQRTQPPAD
jgi:hypothetical protein